MNTVCKKCVLIVRSVSNSSWWMLATWLALWSARTRRPPPRAPAAWHSGSTASTVWWWTAWRVPWTHNSALPHASSAVSSSALQLRSRSTHKLQTTHKTQECRIPQLCVTLATSRRRHSLNQQRPQQTCAAFARGSAQTSCSPASTPSALTAWLIGERMVRGLSIFGTNCFHSYKLN